MRESLKDLAQDRAKCTLVIAFATRHWFFRCFQQGWICSFHVGSSGEKALHGNH